MECITVILAKLFRQARTQSRPKRGGGGEGVGVKRQTDKEIPADFCIGKCNGDKVACLILKVDEEALTQRELDAQSIFLRKGLDNYKVFLEFAFLLSTNQPYPNALLFFSHSYSSSLHGSIATDLSQETQFAKLVLKSEFCDYRLFLL